MFWITGKDIVMKYVNGLEQVTCVSAASEPLALALDVENKYLYYMTFDTEVNTAMLTQLSYTIEQCGMRYILECTCVYCVHVHVSIIFSMQSCD